MKINGKEYGLMYSVSAHVKIAELLPGHSFERLGEVAEDEVRAIETFVKMALIMNEAYEDNKAYYDATHKKDLVKREDLLRLPMHEFNTEVRDAVFRCLANDTKTEVEVEEKKGKKKAVKK